MVSLDVGDPSTNVYLAASGPSAREVSLSRAEEGTPSAWWNVGKCLGQVLFYPLISKNANCEPGREPHDPGGNAIHQGSRTLVV